MDTTTTEPLPTPSPPPPPPTAWYNRPAPALLAGVALLALCGGFAVLWVTTPFFLARPLGYLGGAAGIFLTWGGATGLRQQRAEREWSV